MTYKYLMALVHGAATVTSDWLYQCLEQSSWKPVRQSDVFRGLFARTDKLSSLRDVHININVRPMLFRDMAFFLGPLPQNKSSFGKCRELIEACGGVVSSVIGDADYIVVGKFCVDLLLIPMIDIDSMDD